MEIIIRRTKIEEHNQVLELSLKTFMEFEAPVYSDEGAQTFKKDMIENDDFNNDCLSGKNRIWGAFIQEKLVGLFGMRGESHICLVFTDGKYHRKGIATEVFKKLLADVKIETPDLKKITLNSSPYGLPFYHRIGFTEVEPEKTMNGIIYTPMVYEIL